MQRPFQSTHRDVVADEVPVALARVELGGEAANVAQALWAVAPVRHQRETHRRLRLWTYRGTLIYDKALGVIGLTLNPKIRQELHLEGPLLSYCSN